MRTDTILAILVGVGIIWGSGLIAAAVAWWVDAHFDGASFEVVFYAIWWGLLIAVVVVLLLGGES